MTHELAVNTMRQSRAYHSLDVLRPNQDLGTVGKFNIARHWEVSKSNNNIEGLQEGSNSNGGPFESEN